MSRRAFGTIKQRGNRPGYYVAFDHNGRRIERSGGPTKAVARKKLNAVHACLEMGQSLGDVLSTVFGEFHGSRLTFREAAPLYLENAKSRKKPSTLKNDIYRLRLLCDASWAGEFLAMVTPEAIAVWVETRLESASGATVTFHALRHTAASLMVQAGVQLFDVAKILGHSTLAVTMRYAHFAPESGRRAVALLGESLAGEGPKETGQPVVGGVR